MTATMNLLVHDAVRRDLERFSFALATFPEGDKCRADLLGKAWQFFETMLTLHHTGEDETFFPTFTKLNVDHALLETLAAEHEAMHSAMDKTSAAMQRLVASASNDDAAHAGTALSELDAVARRHMAHEEDGLGPVLEAMADHPNYRAADRRVRKDFTPIQVGQFLAWLDHDAPARSRALLREELSRPVVALMGGVVGIGYRRLAKATWS